MSIFTEIRNTRLIRELERELNSDVLLFGFDGNTFFGCLQSIEDCRVAILAPAIKAKSDEVEILTAGGELVKVNFARVDLWQIVAKGTCIATDPIKNPGDGHNTVRPPAPPTVDAADPTDSQRIQPEGTGERLPSGDLIRNLLRMIGDDITITTFGGFLFEGMLSDVDDCLAVLTSVDIFVPGTSSSISSEDVRSVVVNLEALTSVNGSTT